MTAAEASAGNDGLMAAKVWTRGPVERSIDMCRMCTNQKNFDKCYAQVRQQAKPQQWLGK
jgi:hypothetical protein